MQKFRKTVSLSYVMAEDPDMGTRIIVFHALCIEKTLLTARIRSDDKCCFDDLILESDKKL